jgi:hypothetical protein
VEKKCDVCGRVMTDDECGDEFPEERVCDECAGITCDYCDEVATSFCDVCLASICDKHTVHIPMPVCLRDGTP